MSDINSLVTNVINEALGYAGVEMHNEKYPAMQDDGGSETSPRKAGDPVLAQGGDNDFAKHESHSGVSKAGDPNISYINGKDPQFATDGKLNGDMIGKPVLNFFGRG